ncbi:hypothetical protein [Asticcacaulis endophyticus]|uniref:Uncharacterized protein n=1 Tax=Asticcacaulis endophyticus TaxID=1395890 RepID=A0A918Q5W3_9CAUL|nr:hypothetical protein [Asticcacaulis endophyticus]GGZ31829.1 hypothetical protein GCM10011273_17280 [Asticcacaulis endophyticus]
MNAHTSQPDMKTGRFVCTKCHRQSLKPFTSLTCKGQPIRAARKGAA